MKTKLERGMKMKKKKGFTLIELLAVIVILAIIALIAVPTVMNIISRANKSAFKDSAYGVLKAGENYYMGELLNAQGMTSDKVFDFSKDTSELEINGSKPTNGKMIVNTNGKVAMAIHNGKYCVKKGFEDDDVSISDDVENCKNPSLPNTLIDLATTHSFTSVDGTTTSEVSEVNGCAKSGICEAGTAFAIKVNNTETYKFYVLSDTGNEVTLIMDRNLGETVAWYSDGDDTTYNETTAQGPVTALAALKERTDTWTNLPKITISTFDDVSGVEHTMGQTFTMYARLPKYSEIYEINNSDSLRNSPWLGENLYNNGANNVWRYWTSTANSDSSAGLVEFDDTENSVWTGGGGVSYEEDISGIRPVITLSK